MAAGSLAAADLSEGRNEQQSHVRPLRRTDRYGAENPVEVRVLSSA